MNKKNILLTGASGLLGSSILEVFKNSGHNVEEMDADITDKKAVNNYLLKNKNIDWVIHTAAATNVDLCEKDKNLCYKTNFEGTKNIKNLAKKYNTKLLYISTVSVFSGEEGNYKEDDIPSPKNFYSLSKLLGEIAVLEYELATVLRINLIGIHPKGSRGQNFFEWLFNSIKNNKDIQLFSDVMINPLSNWTVAELIEKIISLPNQDKMLHIASRNILSKADIGNFLIKEMGNYKGMVEIIDSGDFRRGADRPKQMWLNSDFASQKLNLQMPLLQEEIKKILSQNASRFY